MTRREVIEEAKKFVLTSGPSNMLEFGHEMVQNHNHGQWSDEDVHAIVLESHRQADRVYAFLGYVAPR